MSCGRDLGRRDLAIGGWDPGARGQDLGAVDLNPGSSGLGIWGPGSEGPPGVLFWTNIPAVRKHTRGRGLGPWDLACTGPWGGAVGRGRGAGVDIQRWIGRGGVRERYLAVAIFYYSYTPTSWSRWTYRHIHTYINTYIYIYIHTYIITVIHTYIHTHIHTFIHTYIYRETYIHTYIDKTHTHIQPIIHTHIHTPSYIL